MIRNAYKKTLFEHDNTPRSDSHLNLSLSLYGLYNVFFARLLRKFRASSQINTYNLAEKKLKL